MMKAARLEAPGSMTLRDVDKPVAAAGEILVKVLAAGICGSDRHMYRGEYPTARPVTLGHEFSGIVEAVGVGVTRFSGGEMVTIDPNIACGTCKACRNARPNLCERLTAIGVTRDGGFAEYAAVPEAQAFALPAGLDPVHGAFSEPLACCLHAIDKAGIGAGDSVAILGGGVIGDLTGFACAIYMRGIDFIQIPTSVLAQVDSSVGGKTAIDHEKGKNLIGAFHQPRLVLCDLDVLKTLPMREIKCGYAEIIKYGLLGDKTFFEWLEANDDKVLALEPEAILHAVARSVEMKAEIVAADEREGGVRALLNLGHTFGHALEAATMYDSSRLVHGEGVSIGMVLAHRFSARMNLASPDVTDRVEAHLREVGLPTRMDEIPGELPPTEVLMDAIAQDKKVKAGQLTFILTRGLGQSFVADDVPASEVQRFIEEMRPS